MAVDHIGTVRASASFGIRVAACAAMCGVALTGCASPGGGASTHNDVSRCAAVIPTARDLVHSQGALVLVRPVKQTDIDVIVRDATHPPAGAAPKPSTASKPGTTPRPGTAPTSGAPATGVAPTPTVAAAPSTAHRPPGAHPQQAGHTPGPHPQAGRPGSPGRAPRLCLVVYQGSYRADAIPGAQPPTATGKYAMIFLRVRHPSVDRTLITDVLPASTHRPWWHF